MANALTIKPSDDPAMLTVERDISGPATADRIITEALARFGRVDTLLNNAGAVVPKAFTNDTAEDYALVADLNLTGFFWLTQRAVVEMLVRWCPADMTTGQDATCPWKGTCQNARI